MLKVAYLANQFPSPVEWYIADEIRELRRRNVYVIPCSARRALKAEMPAEVQTWANEVLCIQPRQARLLLRAVWTASRRWRHLRPILKRVLLQGRETPGRRLRALVHTVLGAYFAEALREAEVQHIHVHHGYFASWIAMVAARFLDIPFSMTLHGSDLLLHRAFLDLKLAECSFCITVSEFNRRHILANFPEIDSQNVLLQRLGVEITTRRALVRAEDQQFILLSVGRLHPVKDHAFLVRACFFLRESGVPFRCLIVGEGGERRRLQLLIRELRLEGQVKLLGHIAHKDIGSYYESADLVTLTSRSEGMPLALMEAMAREKIVLAPAITGIPELVLDGRTGFLYTPGAMEEFVWRVDQIRRSLEALDSVRHAAREHVRRHFHRETNLQRFGEVFLERTSSVGSLSYAYPVLQ